MADSWPCFRCGTVNEGDRSTCKLCGVAKYTTRSAGAPATETRPRREPPWGARPQLAPVTPVAQKSPPTARRLDWSRPLATGWLLGVGHVALFMTAVIFALSEFGVGQAVLRLVYYPGIANIASWQAGPVIHQVTLILNILPLSGAKWFYLILALACLVMRLVRGLPGPPSLVIAIIAAVYGVLVAMAELPVLIDCWPLTLALLIASWVMVALTLPQKIARRP